MREAVLQRETGEREKAFLLALLSVPSVGSGTVRKLVAETGSAEAGWHASDEVIRHCVKAKAVEGFTEARKNLNPEVLYEAHIKAGVRMIALGEEDYPPMLAEIHKPPVMLFVRGDLKALTGKTLAVVGTRKCTDYGLKVTRHLVDGLKTSGLRDAVIVSGLAAGIDSCAHWAALENGYATTAVFGCGLDVIFPVGNEELAEVIVARGGALVSEYPLGYQASPFTFPQRNRIVVGLSYGVVVVEGTVQSGALITAKLAMEEGRSVYAVPGNLFSPMTAGPLQLIKHGAVPITCARDIAHDLRWVMRDDKAPPAMSQLNLLESKPSSLGETEQKLLALIAYDATPREVVFERAEKKLGMLASQINTMLGMLELDGYVKSLPGSAVCRV